MEGMHRINYGDGMRHGAYMPSSMYTTLSAPQCIQSRSSFYTFFCTLFKLSIPHPIPEECKFYVLVTHSCPTLSDPMNQAPLSVEFSIQEHWSGLPFPSPGDLPTQGLNSSLLHCRQILYHLSCQGSPSFRRVRIFACVVQCCILGACHIFQKLF